MISKRIRGLGAICVTFGLHAATAQADLGDFGAYNATHFTAGGHSVWFSDGQGLFGNSGAQKYHFDPNHLASFSYGADRVVLDGTIIGDGGSFDIHYEYANDLASPFEMVPNASINPKLGGTNNNAAWARANWNYYNLDPAKSYISTVGDPTDIVAQIRQRPVDLSRPFQVGFGANDKAFDKGDFGASGWFDFRVRTGGTASNPIWSGWKQGDVNADLILVPVPGAVILGLMGIGLVTRRRRAAA